MEFGEELREEMKFENTGGIERARGPISFDSMDDTLDFIRSQLVGMDLVEKYCEKAETVIYYEGGNIFIIPKEDYKKDKEEEG